MTSLLFPDTTVLINFALIGRMDLFELLAKGRGRWCATVASECSESAKETNLQDLRLVPAILGEPIYPETAVEHLEVTRLRSELASPGDERYKHYGEAETLAIMTSRPHLSGGFVTDDRGAARLARQKGVSVYSTFDLLALLVRTKKISEDEVLTYFDILLYESRALPEGVVDKAGFLRWLHKRGA